MSTDGYAPFNVFSSGPNLGSSLLCQGFSFDAEERPIIRAKTTTMGGGKRGRSDTEDDEESSSSKKQRPYRPRIPCCCPKHSAGTTRFLESRRTAENMRDRASRASSQLPLQTYRNGGWFSLQYRQFHFSSESCLTIDDRKEMFGPCPSDIDDRLQSSMGDLLLDLARTSIDTGTSTATAPTMSSIEDLRRRVLSKRHLDTL